MGSEEKPDPCLIPIHSKKGIVLYQDICETKTVYAALSGGGGIVGPKFRPVTITGPVELVDKIVDAFVKSLGEAS